MKLVTMKLTTMKLTTIVQMIVTVLAVHAAPAQAHHSWPVNMGKLVTVKGQVTEFKWENPHPMITLNVITADGKQEIWKVGGPAISRMEAKGWTRTTVKPGDVITGEGYQFNDGQKIIRLEKITFADGKTIGLYGGG
jgi:hypothetical protein